MAAINALVQVCCAPQQSGLLQRCMHDHHASLALARLPTELTCSFVAQVVLRSEATTMMGLQKELNEAATALRRYVSCLHWSQATATS